MDLRKSENYVVHRVARDRERYNIESYEDGQQTARLWILEAALNGYKNPMGVAMVRHKRELGRAKENWNQWYQMGLAMSLEKMRDYGYDPEDSLNPQKVVELCQNIDNPCYLKKSSVRNIVHRDSIAIGTVREYVKIVGNKKYVHAKIKTDTGWITYHG